MTTFAVLGAGRQGCAAGYDLLRFQPDARLHFFDYSAAVARQAAHRVNELTDSDRADGAGLDATEQAAVQAALEGVDAVLSAVPYHLNPPLARAAIAAGASFCDLGGNTAIVEEELRLDPEARAAGVSIVPDCGLAPGLGNSLAAYLIEQLDRPRAASIRCGGLPQDPEGPLDYQLVFSVEGLINEYSGTARVLRDGEITEVPTLEEPEQLMVPPLGLLEACTTSGGTSTCPDTYQGVLEAYDYKTIRYPGHFDKVRLLRDLGFFDQHPLEVEGGGSQTVEVAPRKMLERLLVERLTRDTVRDLVILLVTVEGTTAGGTPVRRGFRLLDYWDEATGFTAMERTTAFPAAIICAWIAGPDAPRGAIPLERAMPGEAFMAELQRRDFRLEAIDEE